jgi:transcription initiation factor IIE alpha subunit
VSLLDTRLGLFHCADGHAALIHGEGPFGCPACESSVELRKLRRDVEDLTEDLTEAQDEVRELTIAMDEMQDASQDVT